MTTAKSGQPAHLGEIQFSGLDAEMSRLAAVSGPAAAFRQLASPDLRFYRDRSLPVIGRDRSLALLPAAPAADWDTLMRTPDYLRALALIP